MVASVQAHQGNVLSTSNEAQSNQDVSFNEKESGELPKDLGSMDSNIVESLRSVKRVEPLSQEDDMKVDSKLAHQSECLTSAGNESALNVGLEKTILAMDDAVDGASLLSGTGATADKGSDHLDKSTKTGGEASEDTNLLKDVSQGTSELYPVLDVEKFVSHSSTWKFFSHKDVDQSMPTLGTGNLASGIEESFKSLHKENDHLSPMVETFNTTSGNEQVAKAHEISRTYSFKLEVCLTLSDSAVKEGSCAERPLIPGNCEEAAMRKNHEVAPSKAADSKRWLQSSLVIPKFPAVSYDKSHRSQNRGGTSSKGNNHG